MIVLACVDKNNGMMFNHRRQSQDRAVRSRIERISESGTLRMSPYSAKQWKDHLPKNVVVSEDFLAEAANGDFCFVEDANVAPYEGEIETLILFRWNRVYPEDQSLPINLHQWNLLDAQDFDGSSHREITQEEYKKAAQELSDTASGKDNAHEEASKAPRRQQLEDPSEQHALDEAQEMSAPRSQDDLSDDAAKDEKLDAQEEERFD